MRIHLDDLRRRVDAKVQAEIDRRAKLREAHVPTIPLSRGARLRGLTIARVLPWRRKDPPDAPPR